MPKQATRCEQVSAGLIGVEGVLTLRVCKLRGQHELPEGVLEMLEHAFEQSRFADCGAKVVRLRRWNTDTGKFDLFDIVANRSAVSRVPSATLERELRELIDHSFGLCRVESAESRIPATAVAAA